MFNKIPENMRKAIFLMLILLSSLNLTATVYTVTSASNSGAGTLRQAINDANASTATPHVIRFSAALSGGVNSINITADLPEITRPVSIEGYTNAPAGLTARAISNRTALPVRIRFTSGAYLFGFASGSSNSSVSGIDFIVESTSSGAVAIYKGAESNASNIHIWGCSFNYDYINNTRYASAGTGSFFIGLYGQVGSNKVSNTSNWFIGAKNAGTEYYEGNLIAHGEVYDAVRLINVDRITVSGNYFGVKKDGLTALRSGYAGITGINTVNVNQCVFGVYNASANGVEYQKNIFAGFASAVQICENYETGTFPFSDYTQYYRRGSNKVSGNYIGVNKNGLPANTLSNSSGITLLGTSYNTIGGNSNHERNYINYATYGISLAASTYPYDRGAPTRPSYPVEYNVMMNNYIGVGINGEGSIVDGANTIGIMLGQNGGLLPTANKNLDVSSFNTIENNIIANSTNDGIRIQQTAQNAGYKRYNKITRNRIYNNTGRGIELTGASLDNQKSGIDGNDGAFSNSVSAVQEHIDKPIIELVEIAGAASARVSGFVGNNSVSNPAFANVLVEVFVAHTASADFGPAIFGTTAQLSHGEGLTYVGSGYTDEDGLFSIMVTGSDFSTGTQFTATATSVNGSTSEFGTNMNPTTILPVSLLTFTANAQNSLVVLNWTTAYELNNKGFEIERSNDSRNWVQLGTVLSEHNNISEVVSYSFTDHLPKNGYNYYRLKQVDISGHFTYTEIKIIDFKQKNNSELTVHPNPAKNYILISGLELNTKINVQNSLGVTIQTALADTETKRINIAHLPAGMYYIVLFNSEGRKTIKKIIKE